MGKWAFWLVLLLASKADAGVCKGFPLTEMKIPISSRGITKAGFDRALDRVYNAWEKTVRANGYHLVFNRDWTDGTINSDTDVEGDKWVINSYGGLARFPGMTIDGFTLVACHELGHHLGGAPLYSDTDWASVEGEADYFATLQCGKRIFGGDVKRVQNASLALAKVLAALGEEHAPSIGTPDKSVVGSTYEDHPKAQCRLDTYLAGTACAMPYAPMSLTDPKVASCWIYSPAAESGSRPLCWFKP